MFGYFGYFFTMCGYLGYFFIRFGYFGYFSPCFGILNIFSPCLDISSQREWSTLDLLAPSRRQEGSFCTVQPVHHVDDVLWTLIKTTFTFCRLNHHKNVCILGAYSAFYENIFLLWQKKMTNHLPQAGLCHVNTALAHFLKIEENHLQYTGLGKMSKKTVFLGLCPKLWVGGGPKSQTF